MSVEKLREEGPNRSHVGGGNLVAEDAGGTSLFGRAFMVIFKKHLQSVAEGDDVLRGCSCKVRGG